LQLSKKIARVISDIFIPPTFNLLGFIYIAFFSEFYLTEQLIVISSSIIFGVILPITFFVILRKRKIIADNDAVIKEQRHAPYYLSILLNVLGMVYIIIFSGNSLAEFYWLVLTINTVILTFVNYFLGSWWYYYAVIFIVVIGLSRYKLGVHTPAQIGMGTLYGFFGTLLQLKIFSGEI
jgi:membrane-associated phospholipid phosphatase